MKSDIQLICAEGYLHSMTKNLKTISIDYNLIEDKKLLPASADADEQREEIFLFPGTLLFRQTHYYSCRNQASN